MHEHVLLANLLTSLPLRHCFSIKDTRDSHLCICINRTEMYIYNKLSLTVRPNWIWMYVFVPLSTWCCCLLHGFARYHLVLKHRIPHKRRRSGDHESILLKLCGSVVIAARLKLHGKLMLHKLFASQHQKIDTYTHYTQSKWIGYATAIKPFVGFHFESPQLICLLSVRLVALSSWFFLLLFKRSTTLFFQPRCFFISAYFSLFCRSVCVKH